MKYAFTAFIIGYMFSFGAVTGTMSAIRTDILFKQLNEYIYKSFP